MSNKTKKIIGYIFALFIPVMFGCLIISCWSFDLYNYLTGENIDDMAMTVNFTIFALIMIVGPFATGIGVYILTSLKNKEKELEDKNNLDKKIKGTDKKGK